MEHLIFEADCPQQMKSTYLASSLKMNWESNNELMDFVAPQTRWLGFDHDSLNLCCLSDYPTAAGFTEACLWNANFRDSRSDFAELPAPEVGRQIVAFFQAWLFFGLLESVVLKKIETSYFVRQNYLYTRNLHFCLQSRVFSIRANPATKARTNEDIQLDIRLVHRWVSRFTAWSHPSFRLKVEASYPGLLDILEDIVPAIIRLAESIEQTRLFALLDQPFMGTLFWQYPFQAHEARRVRLKQLGWCPFQIRLLQDTVNHSTMDWIVACQIQQDPVGHQKCTRNDCVRNNIDNSTYKQTHVCTGAQCKKLTPSVSQIMDVIRQDEIPIVRLERASGVDRLVVTAISKTSPGPFVAISHVWADGLGGATETGLNKCQVERVSSLCTSVLEGQGSAWFWLDCLCIPRADKDIYYKALDGIKDVYKCATSVLVIDKTIQRCLVDSPTEYLYAHIYLSAWMQRMWTYEEAVLSRELVFALKNGLYKYRVDTRPSMRQTVCVVWQSLASQLFRLRAGPEHLTIGHIYQAFRYRLCNVPQDEFISVAGMLGLDTMALLHETGDERTKAFWLMLKWVPSDVVFLDGPKLSIQGFQWAPRTLMNPSSTALDSDINGEKAECTVDGLIGTYNTIQFYPVLIGRGRDHGSVSYLWVNGSDESVQAPGDHRALLRVYCVENWPSGGSSFDLIILHKSLRYILKPGQWIPGAALNSQSDTSPYSYIGRVLVERIKNEEMTASDGTIMFEGTSQIVVDTEGKWGRRKLCII